MFCVWVPRHEGSRSSGDRVRQADLSISFSPQLFVTRRMCTLVAGDPDAAHGLPSLSESNIKLQTLGDLERGSKCGFELLGLLPGRALRTISPHHAQQTRVVPVSLA